MVFMQAHSRFVKLLIESGPIIIMFIVRLQNNGRQYSGEKWQVSVEC